MVIEVEVNGWMLGAADDLARQMGVLNNSLVSGSGNRAGAIGEMIVMDHIESVGIGAGIVSEYTHDIETEDQRSVEVKTKRRKHPPRPEWTVSMTLASWHRQSAAADVLAFAQVTPDLSRGWLLGFCTPEHFESRAWIVRAGEADGDNGFVARCDMMNMEIGDLEERFPLW